MKTLKNISKYDSKLYAILREKYSKKLSEYMKTKSPFKDKIIHRKTMITRKLRGSNVFEINNPMHNIASIKKKVEKTSGKNHYLVKKYRYSYSKDNGNTWTDLPNLPVKQICILQGWTVSVFNYVLSGKIPKRGKMKNERDKMLKLDGKK